MSDPARLGYNPALAPGPRAATRPRSGSAFRWVVAATAVLLAALIGLVTLLLIGFSTGPVPFLTGLVVAALPAPVYVLLVLWIDRFESEPGWLLATAFFWGALVAVGVALIVNTLGMVAVDAAFGEEAADLYGLALSAPLVEEGTKALALFILYFWKRDEFDGVLDGIVYASMVGLGFAMTENIKYYAEAALEGRALGTFVVRGMFSPYAHPLFTSMTGIGLGLASHAARRSARVTLPFVGLALAVVLHSVWNTSLFFSDKLERGLIALVMYFLVMVPVFTGVLMVAFFGLRKEGRILREHLAGDVERGTLARVEYERLCSVRRRLGASLGALFGGGFSAWRDRLRLHGVASELAFHRHRVARGWTPRDSAAVERETHYLQSLVELRGRLSG
ncbi:MAG TPA: PrsW family intramembrane metalloprotease [Pyrinomonadaceae bacterium]